MATPQYKHSNPAPVMAPVATAKAVALGDLVGQSSSTLVKASDTVWDTNLATTQAAFVALFMGVSAQRKDANVARPYGNSVDNYIRVDTDGVYEFDCASASFDVGDLVGPAKDTGNALLDNKVVAVGSSAAAIGRVHKKGASVTRVQVKILSTLYPTAK
jgi:hypothetical protein